MSWTDRKSIGQILKLRDEFKIKTFLETGTFMGINARYHADNFDKVITVELKEEYFIKSLKKLHNFENVESVNLHSPIYLASYAHSHRNDTEITFIYLDAHFYDPTLPIEKRFVILDELKALKNMKNVILCIHDFDNGLGHITYDNIPLDWNLLKADLKKVNPDFHYYTNELSGCEIYNTTTIINSGMIVDYDTMENVRYANLTPRLKFRGILYCIPKELNLENYELKKWPN